MKDKKICLVIPSLVGGGMERIMSEFANYLAHNGADVYVLIMFKDEIFYNLDQNITLIQPSHKKRYNLTYAFYLFPFLRIRIKKIYPDTILSFGERYNSYLLLSMIGLRIPVYISDRSSPNKNLSRFNLWMSKILYRRASGIIAQTSKASELMSDRLDSPNPNIRVIPNPLRMINRITIEKKDQIIALGRLVKEKRYERLLEIISKLRNKSWNLIIVGDGYLRQEVENMINDLNLQNRVTLAGQQKDVDRFLSESKIYVLTSDIEGYPNALCEAMAHGLACISFDCVAGPGDIIRNGENGILVEEGNIEHFAKELDSLIVNKKRRETLGDRAKKIQEDLGQDKIFRRYLDFILNNTKQQEESKTANENLN
jgi:glycosyltransferase involved in cell wall biosynthesis